MWYHLSYLVSMTYEMSQVRWHPLRCFSYCKFYWDKCKSTCSCKRYFIFILPLSCFFTVWDFDPPSYCANGKCPLNFSFLRKHIDNLLKHKKVFLLPLIRVKSSWRKDVRLIECEVIKHFMYMLSRDFD